MALLVLCSDEIGLVSHQASRNAASIPKVMTAKEMRVQAVRISSASRNTSLIYCAVASTNPAPL